MLRVLYFLTMSRLTLQREGKKADALEPVPIASQKSIHDQTG